MSKLCSVNNGGCSHFCELQAERSVCRCAAGYRLGSDKRTCEPTGKIKWQNQNTAVSRGAVRVLYTLKHDTQYICTNGNKWEQSWNSGPHYKLNRACLLPHMRPWWLVVFNQIKSWCQLTFLSELIYELSFKKVTRQKAGLITLHFSAHIERSQTGL